MSDVRRTRQPRSKTQRRVALPIEAGILWAMSLRCHNCSALILLKEIPSMRVHTMADSTVCPQCGAVSEPYTMGAPGFAKRHLIVSLKKKEP
jgi:hypothetical protein